MWCEARSPPDWRLRRPLPPLQCVARELGCKGGSLSNTEQQNHQAASHRCDYDAGSHADAIRRHGDWTSREDARMPGLCRLGVLEPTASQRRGRRGLPPCSAEEIARQGCGAPGCVCLVGKDMAIFLSAALTYTIIMHMVVSLSRGNGGMA